MTKPYIRVLAARQTDTSYQFILQTPNGGTQFRTLPVSAIALVADWLVLNVENPFIPCPKPI